MTVIQMQTPVFPTSETPTRPAPPLHELTVAFVHGGGSLWHPSFRLDHDWFRKNLIDYDFWYIYQGEGYLRDPQGRTLALHQGTCLWMMPGSLFEIWRKPGSKFGTRYFHFHLHDAQANAIGPAQLQDVPLMGDMAAMAHFETTTRRMSDLIALESQSAEQNLLDQARQTINQLLKGLLMDYLLASRMKQVYSQDGVEESQFKMALSLVSQIHENPAAFDLGHFTQRVGYSDDHLRRLIKRVVGKTPHQIIIDAKIKRAMFLLQESTHSVSDIADELGYDNIHYFSLQFKKVTGQSPTLFRQNHRPKE